MFKSFSFYFALLGIILAILVTHQITKPLPPLYSASQLPKSPFKNFIQASGIIQSFDKNIFIGVPSSNLVQSVFVKVGDAVNKGDPLFQLDSRALEANLRVQKANLEVERSNYKEQKERFELYDAVNDPKAISRDELINIENKKDIAKAKMDFAEAQVLETIDSIDRLMIRAPKKGHILQFNIRPGEYVNIGDRPVVLGNISQYQILVSIDEQIAPEFSSKSPAVAFPKNSSEQQIPLIFDHIEPYVIPKQSLTGLNKEIIDTRVLQVVYTFEASPNYNLYVGQQMDVFIEK